jgi:hypothetical protein
MYTSQLKKSGGGIFARAKGGLKIFLSKESYKV